VCVYAINLFIIFYKDGRMTKNVALVLSLEIISNFIRFVVFAIDPLCSNGVTVFFFSRMFLTVTFSWSLASSVAISWTWWSAMKIYMKGYYRVAYVFGIIFIAVILLTLLTEFVAAFLFAIYIEFGNFSLVELSGGLLAGAQFFIGAFYFIVGLKLISIFRNSNKVSKTKVSGKLIQMTIRITISSFGMLTFTIASITILTDFFYSGVGYVVVMLLCNFGIEFSSVCTVLAFSSNRTFFWQSPKLSTSTKQTELSDSQRNQHNPESNELAKLESSAEFEKNPFLKKKHQKPIQGKTLQKQRLKKILRKQLKKETINFQ